MAGTRARAHRACTSAVACLPTFCVASGEPWFCEMPRCYLTSHVNLGQTITKSLYSLKARFHFQPLMSEFYRNICQLESKIIVLSPPRTCYFMLFILSFSFAWTKWNALTRLHGWNRCIYCAWQIFLWPCTFLHLRLMHSGARQFVSWNSNCYIAENGYARTERVLFW